MDQRKRKLNKIKNNLHFLKCFPMEFSDIYSNHLIDNKYPWTVYLIIS